MPEYAHLRLEAAHVRIGVPDDALSTVVAVGAPCWHNALEAPCAHRFVETLPANVRSRTAG